MRNAFNYVLVDRAGVAQAGMDDQNKAEMLAKQFGWTVKENVICELRGTLKVSTANAFLDGESLGSAILNATKTIVSRGNNSQDFGFVSITIKPTDDETIVSAVEVEE